METIQPTETVENVTTLQAPLLTAEDYKNKAKLFAKIQKARVKVLGHDINKSGYNKYGNWHYITMKDFIGLAMKILDEVGLSSMYRLHDDAMKASLEIIDVETGYACEFTTPVGKAMPDKGTLPIQDLGARNTYGKRYLYFNLLELEETDATEELAGMPDDGAKQAPKRPIVKKANQAVAKAREQVKAENTQESDEVVEKVTDEQIQLIKQLVPEATLTQSLDKINKGLYELTFHEANQLITWGKAKAQQA